MKKIFALAASLLICVSSSFAYTNIIQLGVKGAVPQKITGKSSSETADFTLNSTGISIGYIGTFDSGFSFKDTASLGFGSGKSTASYIDKYHGNDGILFNLGVTEVLGLGYAVVNQRNLFVGLYGNFGTYLDLASSIKTSTSSTVTSVTLVPSFLLGGDVTVVYTPSKVFSLYGNISVNAEWSNVYASTVVSNSTSGYAETLNTAAYSCKPHLRIIPAVGIAWKF